MTNNPTHVCVTVCQFRDRVFKQGEKLEARTDEVIPRHFQPLGSVPEPVPEEEIEDEMKTFADITRREYTQEEKPMLLKLNKDDLIGKATDLGLSEGRDLVALTKKELADLIIESTFLG